MERWRVGDGIPTPGPSREGNGISDIQRRTSDIQRRTSDIQRRTSNIQRRTSNVQGPVGEAPIGYARGGRATVGETHAWPLPGGELIIQQPTNNRQPTTC